MAIRRLNRGLYSPVNYPTDLSYLVQPHTWKPSTTQKIIFYCHGYGGDATQPSLGTLVDHTAALAAAGWSVFGLDHAAINAFGDQDAMRAIDDAYTYATTTLGYNTKIAFMGWSMGGLTALNWINRNPSKVSCAWLWNPATDLQWFRDAAGSYTPTYSNGSAPQAPFTVDVNTAYTASTTASGGATLAASGGGGVTVPVTKANGFSDAFGATAPNLPVATAPGGSFTYTGKTDTSLTGCVSTGAGFSVTAAQAITSDYANSKGGLWYNPWVQAAAIGSRGVPIRVSQASDDIIVAPGMNADAVNGFVARAASPNVTLRTPQPTGGHTSSIPTVPPAEVVAWYAARI